jgi:AcrR family transcriptional regulator
MPRTRAPLSRDRVLDAAMRMADEHGIESLTMRKLARSLGVEAMSLYNHVANKGDLVEGIVDRVLSEIDLPDVPEWDVAIRECAISAHEALLRHPWACSVVLSTTRIRLEGNPRVEYMEWLLRRLREAGFSPELVYHAYHTIDSHILGFTVWQLGHSAGARAVTGGKDFRDFIGPFVQELRAREYPYLAEHAEQHVAAPPDDGAREFEFGLDLILEGLKRVRQVGRLQSRPT